MADITATLHSGHTGIRVRGRDIVVRSADISGRTIIVNGRWLRTAVIKDEAFVEGDVVSDPVSMIGELRAWDARPDMFTFAQKITDPAPRFHYWTEWDNFAVIRITTYEDWLKQIRKDARENLRRAQREGVEVRISAYDQEFICGIKALYDETPIRQGTRFWHYGKSFEALAELHGTYGDRAEYIGAYLNEELIGFIKMVYVDNFAKTMHVISKEKYWKKRPTNALIGKAVETCAEKKLSFLIYGEYSFPAKTKASLTEFKRRNGFEEVRYPRYFIPLTAKGWLALRVRLHRGWRRYVPEMAANVFRKARAAYFRRKVI